MSTRAVAVSLTLVAVSAGCQSILGLEEGKRRPDGEGGATSSSPTTSSTTGTSSGSGGASGLGGGAGGCDVGSCPAAACHEAFCNDEGACDVRALPAQAPCAGDGRCDEAGVCRAPSCTDGVLNGSETEVDCGGSSCALCPVLLLLGGGGSTTLVTGEYDPRSASWTVAGLNGVSYERPALVITAEGQGVGLIRAATTDELSYTTWQPGGGAWTPFVAMGDAITARSAPSLSAGSSGAWVAYQRLTYLYDSAVWTGALWLAPAPLGGVGTESYGPSAPALAAHGDEATAVFMNGAPGSQVNHLFARRVVGEDWQSPQDLASGTNYELAPELASLASSQDRLAVYVGAPPSDQQIFYVRQSASTLSWSPALPIANALTAERPSLAALADGGAILAFRGTDGKLYLTRYDGARWTSPAGVTTPTVNIVAPPAVTRGVGGAEIELVYVTAGGVASHVRYLAGAWTTPIVITTSTGLARVALAGAP
jgi:hypothetical protein